MHCLAIAAVAGAKRQIAHSNLSDDILTQFKTDFETYLGGKGAVDIESKGTFRNTKDFIDFIDQEYVTKFKIGTADYANPVKKLVGDDMWGFIKTSYKGQPNDWYNNIDSLKGDVDRIKNNQKMYDDRVVPVENRLKAILGDAFKKEDFKSWPKRGEPLVLDFMKELDTKFNNLGKRPFDHLKDAEYVLKLEEILKNENELVMDLNNLGKAPEGDENFDVGIELEKDGKWAQTRADLNRLYSGDKGIKPIVDVLKKDSYNSKTKMGEEFGLTSQMKGDFNVYYVTVMNKITKCLKFYSLNGNTSEIVDLFNIVGKKIGFHGAPHLQDYLEAGDDKVSPDAKKHIKELRSEIVKFLKKSNVKAFLLTDQEKQAFDALTE